MMKGLFTGAFLRAALLVAALCVAGCDRGPEGAVRVTVLGGAPKVADPAAGPLDPGERLLLANVAQGLVRFDAQGNIDAGLAERWNVSDDGLSYIFRLQTGEWPSGRKITAQDVARLLRRQIAAQSRNELKDTVGAITKIVAMTDRVLEIDLAAPRPHLLQLLAQPEFAILRDGQGTGPFEFADSVTPGSLRLTRKVAGGETSDERTERVELRTDPVEQAVAAFVDGRADLVTGGTFADLAVARAVRLPRGTLRFDPVAGLFGFQPARAGGLLADAEVRALLDRSLDRAALVEALGIPGLDPRASLLQPGLDGGIVPATPQWAATALAERREALVAEAQRLFADRDEPPLLRVALPDGAGGEAVLARLQADWGALGIRVERTGPKQAADLKLVDAVAPSVSPAWFLRQFRCGFAPVCVESADGLLDAGRLAPVAQQRNAFLAEAERQMREAVIFIPVAAPVRWSLVSRGLPGFSENRFAVHTLTGLREKPERER